MSVTLRIVTLAALMFALLFPVQASQNAAVPSQAEISAQNLADWEISPAPADVNRKAVRGGGNTDDPRILLMYADYYSTTIRDSLIASGYFTGAQIDTLNRPPSITLAQLQPYDAVLVWTNTTFTNPTNIGDVLQQYVDQGGGVIIAVYAYTTGWPIAGGILNANYSPFLPTGGSAVSGTIDMNSLTNPNHPIFEGIVTAPTYWNNANFSNPPLNTGGILLASDTGGNRAVAENPTGKVVGICINAKHVYHNTNHETVMLFGNAFNYVIESAPLLVTLTPNNPPIVIPAGGGGFSFEADVENATTDPITFDAWTEVVLPNGAVFGPLVLRTNLLIPGSAVISRTIGQNVPGGAPPGEYTYRGKVGVHPDSVVNEDTFIFTKLAGDASPGQNQGWAVHGWFGDDASLLDVGEYAIFSATPNPFNPVTTLNFTLESAENVDLAVFDIKGREVAQLAGGFYPAGTYQISWDASAMPSGMYFARLIGDNFKETVKLLLVK